MSYEFIFKYIVIGDSSVGKSCICDRFCHGAFDANHEKTIAVDFFSKIVDVNGRKIKLQIWDSAGCESFKSVTQAYYRGTAVAVVMYDISVRKTFKAVKEWIRDIRMHCPPEIVIILVGNKSDLGKNRQVYTMEAEKYAKDNEILFCETSAKNGKNVDDIFIKSAEVVYLKLANNIKISGVKLGIEMDINPKPSWTCSSICGVG